MRQYLLGGSWRKYGGPDLFVGLPTSLFQVLNLLSINLRHWRSGILFLTLPFLLCIAPDLYLSTDRFSTNSSIVNLLTIACCSFALGWNEEVLLDMVPHTLRKVVFLR